MTGVILAGGKSARMRGTDKAFLQRDGQRVIERNAQLLREACGDCVLVARDSSQAAELQLPRLRTLVDTIPGCGPLAGLNAAFQALHDDLFVLACDLPLLEAPLLQRMTETFQKTHPRVLLPRTPDGNGWRDQPLCAIWSKAGAPDVAKALAEKNLALYRLLQTWPDISRLDLNPQEAAWLKNVNTPEDLA